MEYHRWRKYLVAVWALVETFLFAGLLYGWAPMVWIFKQESVFADLCADSLNNVSGYDESTVITYGIPGDNGSTLHVQKDSACKPQDDRFALAFTIGSAIFCASSAAYGYVIYRAGTRVTRIISMSFFFGGTLMLAFVDKDEPWLVFPGLTAMGVGGLPILITNAQISNLFVKGSSTFIGLLCGSYDASVAVLLIIKIAYENGLHSRYSYGILTGLHTVVGVSTFVFLPKGHIRKPLEKEKSKDENGESFIPDVQDADSSVYAQTTEPLERLSRREQHPSLKSCIISDTYLLHVMWLSILQLRFYYFLASMNSYLHRITHDDKELVSYFTNMLIYIMVGGCVSSTLAGVLYDWQRRVFKGRRSATQRQLLPAVLPMSIASGLGLLLSFLGFVHTMDILYFTFIVMTLLRSFLYSVGTAFLTAMFPSEYFGILYGLMIISAGVFGCFQFALFTWTQSYPNAPLHSDILCACLSTLSFIHPLYQWYKCHRANDFKD